MNTTTQSAYQQNRSRRLTALADAIEQKVAKGESIADEIARLRRMAQVMAMPDHGPRPKALR